MEKITFCDEPLCGAGRTLCHACAERIQRELERAAVDLGVDRHKKGAPQDVASQWCRKLEKRLRAYVKERDRTRGPKPALYRWLGKVKPDRLAFVALHAVLQPRRVSKTRDEWIRFPDDPIPVYMLERDIAWRLRLEPSVEATYTLLKRLEEATGLVRLETVEIVNRKGRRTPNCVVATDLGRRVWTECLESDSRFRRPVKLPMVQPPRDWGPDGFGGYRHALRRRLPLVRRRGRTAAIDVPAPVRAAVSHLQHTPWRVNLPVLRLVKEIVARGAFEKPAGGEPERDRKRRESKRRRVEETLREAELMGEAVFYIPHNLDWRGRIQAVNEWLNIYGGDLPRALLEFAVSKQLGPDGADALRVHGANCAGQPAEIERPTRAERIAWVHENSDAIVRAVAAVGGWITGGEIDPASRDLLRGADAPLQFYAFALEWAALKAHERAGESPETFWSHLPVAQDHTANARQHIAALLRDEEFGRKVNLVPSDRPNDIYRDVEARVAARVRLGGGSERAPAPAQPAGVEFDRATAAAVNAFEADPTASPFLRLSDDREFWAPSFWRGRITRKIVKRPGMTYDYGATKNAFAEKIEEWIWEEIAPRQFTDWVGDATWWLAEAVWGVLDGSEDWRRWREWTQDVARKLTARDGSRPVAWTIPVTGFRVVQDATPDYWQKRDKEIPIKENGKVIATRYKPVPKTPRRVNQRKQIDAIAPNIIHSLDAAALALTVNRAAEREIDLGAVHDCYYTRAADVKAVARCAREAFVDLHADDRDVLGDLHEQFRAHGERFNADVSPLDEALRRWSGESPIPDPPDPGELEIRDVLNSEYFVD